MREVPLHMVRVYTHVERNAYQGRKAPRGWCENRAGNVIVTNIFVPGKVLKSTSPRAS